MMENFLRSKEIWSLIEDGVPIVGTGATEAQKKAVEAVMLKDLKVKNFLFQAIDREIMETILDKGTSKSIWDSMRQKYQGSTKVRRAQLQALRTEFETLSMKDGEKVDKFLSRTLTVVNKMKIHGEKVQQSTVVSKILRSLTSKFNYVVCSIEESNDLDTLSIDELHGSLLVHEQRMQEPKEEDQALKITYDERATRGWGRNSYRGFRGRGRGRGRQQFNKELIECYNCHKLGHFQYECPGWTQGANFAELDEDEEMLLMAHVELHNATREEVWFLDTGCSNHMTGNRMWFTVLDDEFRHSVKLGNNTRMMVMGKGIVRMQVEGEMQVITEVYYIPELKNNLLSVGQLQEKGLAILIKNNICKLFHPMRGLIMKSSMSTNRLFVLLASIKTTEHACFNTVNEEESRLWHCRLGHLNFKGLRTLYYKKMVKGLPLVKSPGDVCEGCIMGKQHRDCFPKQSQWKAPNRLQLIHADISTSDTKI